ncbi:MAG: hypothetical protein AAGB46_18905, partial [Verrucomicrobiota bacterium]
DIESRASENDAIAKETNLDSFLSDVDWDLAKLELDLALEGLGPDELQEMFIDALARDLEEKNSFEAAGMILEEIALQDPLVGEALLNALSPAEKTKLASALAKGWAEGDPMGAWDWITVSWMDPNGEYLDRKLQYSLFYDALDVVLTRRKEYQVAADLVRQEYEPELKEQLAELIAKRVVSDNPSDALSRIEFDSDDEIDQAILDAIVDEWSQRDFLGVKNWALSNEQQVSELGVRKVAKQLLLNEAELDLLEFHSGLGDVDKRDAAAAEVGRLTARREPDLATHWLNAIQSGPRKQIAVKGALYELGHDDFEATVGLLDGVYDVRSADRLPLMTDALLSWSRVDVGIVESYLASGREVYLPRTLDEFRKYVESSL